MIVDITEHRVAFDERRYGIARMLRRKAHIDRIAEHAGVAEEMAGRKARSVRHRKGWEQRMRIGKIHAFVPYRRHGRRRLRCHRQGAQAVRNKQDKIAWALCAGQRDLHENGGARY